MHTREFSKWLISGGVITGLGVVLTFVFFDLPSSEYTLDQGAQASPLPASVEQTTSPILTETANALCQGQLDSPIAYKHLSEEGAVPFIIAGRPLQSDRHDYEEYTSSIARFPDVRSCLIASEKEKDAPNLSLFDWEKIKDTYDAEVCLFRITSSIGDVQEVKRWLEGQGFNVPLISTISKGVMSQMLNNDNAMPGTALNATWSAKECGARFGNMIEKLRQATTHGLSVGVIFSADGDVVGASAIHIVL